VSSLPLSGWASISADPSDVGSTYGSKVPRIPAELHCVAEPPEPAELAFAHVRALRGGTAERRDTSAEPHNLLRMELCGSAEVLQGSAVRPCETLTSQNRGSAGCAGSAAGGEGLPRGRPQRVARARSETILLRWLLLAEPEHPRVIHHGDSVAAHRRSESRLVVSVLVSFTAVRSRSERSAPEPRPLVSTLPTGCERTCAGLESVLVATPQGFESPILRGG
jgi:hypothetical protein